MWYTCQHKSLLKVWFFLSIDQGSASDSHIKQCHALHGILTTSVVLRWARWLASRYRKTCKMTRVSLKSVFVSFLLTENYVNMSVSHFLFGLCVFFFTIALDLRTEIVPSCPPIHLPDSKAFDKSFGGWSHTASILGLFMACIFKMINRAGFAMVMWNIRRAQTKNVIDIAVFWIRPTVKLRTE